MHHETIIYTTIQQMLKELRKIKRRHPENEQVVNWKFAIQKVHHIQICRKCKQHHYRIVVQQGLSRITRIQAQMYLHNGVC